MPMLMLKEEKMFLIEIAECKGEDDNDYDYEHDYE